jgi:hypothetical protein
MSKTRVVNEMGTNFVELEFKLMESQEFLKKLIHNRGQSENEL